MPVATEEGYSPEVPLEQEFSMQLNCKQAIIIVRYIGSAFLGLTHPTLVYSLPAAVYLQKSTGYHNFHSHLQS